MKTLVIDTDSFADPSKREGLLEQIRRLPDWAVLIDDQSEPWYRLPDGYDRTGTPFPATGLLLVGITSEGEFAWVAVETPVEPGIGILTMEGRTASMDEQEMFIPVPE